MNSAEFRQRYALGRSGRARSKYRNVATIGDDPSGGKRRYASKREKAMADSLNQAVRDGEIRDWLPQPSLVYGLAENGRSLRYVADALIIHPDGSYSFVDAKGFDSPASKAKRAALRQRGLDVKLV